MKKVILIVLLLFSISGFSQPEKDSLFARDAREVYNKLKLMHYLERSVMEYYLMSEDERLISQETFQYYLKKNVIGINPVPDINILRYLGFHIKESIPTNWNTYMIAVNNANAKSLLDITEKYGYPSDARILKYTGLESISTSIIFALRKNRYDDELNKMIRKEYKKENISESEYDLYKALSGKEALNSKDIKKLQKKGNKMIFKGKEQ